MCSFSSSFSLCVADPKGFLSAPISERTLSDWISAITEHDGEEGSTLAPLVHDNDFDALDAAINHAAERKLSTVLTAETFSAHIAAFTKAESDLQFSPSAKWSGTRGNAARATSIFVAKAALPAGTHVHVFGDLHGSLYSLVRDLRHLRDHALSDLKLTAPAIGDDLVVNRGHALVFCGDLVDRGLHGPEVLALVLALRMRNPTTVFLTRGNHESILVSLSEGKRVVAGGDSV